MKLSVVIPAHNEEERLEKVVEDLIRELASKDIAMEMIIVNDNSTDSTPAILERLSARYPEVKPVHNGPPNGFGRAVKKGLENACGEAIVIYMGDGSDDPHDVYTYYLKLLEGFDCVFGSRFIKGSKVKDYPRLKLILNRLGNAMIQTLFLIRYNDVSNAFKAYRTDVVRSIEPFVSQYFNITVEIPLKAIIRGFSYSVIPIKWSGRGSGVSKYRIRELTRKYIFSIFFVWLEKILLKGNAGKERLREYTHS